jgi:F-type H+-transporting ATPase subunit epsilon
MKFFNVQIVTPESSIFEESQAESVILPTVSGEITVLPEHIPLVSLLSSGEIIVHVEGEPVPFAVVGGIVKVTRESVVVLADFAQHIASVEDDAVMNARERAAELEKAEHVSVEEMSHARAMLERSLVAERIKGKWQTKKYRA